MNTLILKIDTLYGAYAPGFDVFAYGTCRDEAVNNLTEEIASHQNRGEDTILKLPKEE